jgi:hypothetical protein
MKPDLLVGNVQVLFYADFVPWQQLREQVVGQVRDEARGEISPVGRVSR